MRDNIDFTIPAREASSGQRLSDLEQKLKHLVFRHASIDVGIDKYTHLINSVHIMSLYRHYEIKAIYVPSKSESHIEVKVEIADFAPSEVRTVIRNVLLDVFNYKGK